MSARRKTPDRDFTDGALPYFYQKRGTTGAAADPRLIEELIITALQPGPDGTGVSDLKPINRLVREMREASRMFAPFAGKRKCVVFGSARTASDRAEAQVAEAFSRKTSIVKEADANALFPGGFGTMDELLEALTLIQTGKAAIMPVVMVDKPGGSYWHMWPAFVGAQIFGRGLISALDFSLFKFTENVNEAADEVLRFCPVFHSYRHVGRDLVIRMNRPLSDVRLAHLNEHFRDLLASGGFRQGAPPAAEQPEPEIASMPRLIFHFKRRSFGRLRQLIDALNASEPE